MAVYIINIAVITVLGLISRVEFRIITTSEELIENIVNDMQK